MTITLEERAEWRAWYKRFKAEQAKAQVAAAVLSAVSLATAEANARADGAEESMSELTDYTRDLEALLQKHFPEIEPGAVKEADLIVSDWKARAEQAELRVSLLSLKNYADIAATALAFIDEAIRQTSEGKARVEFGIICCHCGHKSADGDAAKAHDAICEKHPAVMRAQQAEAERDALVGILSEIDFGCPYFYRLELAGCTPQCGKDDKDCWIAWARAEAQKRRGGNNG